MDPTVALRETFGFDAFRPGQEDAVRAAIGPPARDVLVVMPTGAGKSLCYQLPALVRDDVTLVVSPLVSLMQDQVEALAKIAPGRVALVNSQRDAADNRAALQAAADGELRLLYVAPERFSSAPFLQAMKDIEIGLFVVDEAHCVSQWGHDFRPDYFRLADAARWLQAEAIIASTATATPQVANDIAQRLGLRDPVRVATGFDRPNLSFGVIPCASAQAKQRHIAAALQEPGATPAIVYAGTRNGAEKLAAHLSGNLDGAVAAYHAGLGREQRADVQRRFMDGRLDVVVATNAFGMGIDKANVRTVCHESVPGSIEAYYQEAGRAGRDGRPARALLFAEGRDKGLHVFFIQRGELSDEAIATVAMRLQARASEGRYDLGADELAALLDGDARENDDQVRAVVGHLARAGVIRPAPSSPDRVRGRIEGPFDGRARAACRTSAGESTRARWSQYRAVWKFVESDACRRTAILRHFGDRSTPAPMDGRAVLRRLRPVVGARRARGEEQPQAPGRRAAGGGRRPRRGDRRGRRDRRPGGRAHAHGRDPARRALAGAGEERPRRPARLRDVRPPHRQAGHGARRRAARGRPPALDRRDVPQAQRRATPQLETAA